MIQIIKYPPRENWSALLKRPAMDFSQLESTVKQIMLAVKIDGDAALVKFAQKFDQSVFTSLELSAAEIDLAVSSLNPELKAAINQAKINIGKFHSAQKEEINVIETMPGVTCFRKSVGIEKVGIYVPGGSAPLFSTVLMLAVPAQIAGCKEIIMCTPCGKNGEVHPATIYAATISGVTRIFRTGGAQAIAALAYGTETIPAVDKIFGPGNQFVTMAKMVTAASGIAIDMPAGPSEVMVIADASANPAFIAADLLSQAEHGSDSQAILVTTCEEMLGDILNELFVQLSVLPRKELAKQSLVNGKIILVKDNTEALEIANLYAAEHLILAVNEPESWIDQIINAGSVFLGHYTPESAGDYASGTNHTLPTNGFARAYSGVSLDSFVKEITFQQISPAGLQKLGPIVEIMAEAELLAAHKNAVTIRLSELANQGNTK